MREQKYADVLKKYEEELKTIEEAEDETFERETEEKLSMTRELKFQELQKHIDDTFLEEIEVEDTDDMGDTSPVDQEAIEQKFLDFVENPSQKEETKVPSEKEEVPTTAPMDETTTSSPKKEEDIYLTTSFQPFRKRFRFKKAFKVLLTLLVLCGVLVALGYFVFLPLYHKYVDSKPKMIFDHTIDSVSEGLVRFIDDHVVSSDLFYFDINFKLNSNVDNLSYLSDSRYGFRFGVDPTDKNCEGAFYIKDGHNEYGLHTLERDGKSYLKFSTSDTYLDLGETSDSEDVYSSFASILEDISVNKDDLIYYIEKHASIFKELVDASLIQTSKDEMVIDGNTIAVTRNSFVLDAKAYEKVQKRYIELLKEDEKLLKIAASLEDLSVSDYEEYLDDSIEEIEDDYKWCINIYTIKGNQFVGIDEEINGFRDFYYYNVAGDFEVYMNLTEDEDCLQGNDCVVTNQDIINLVGKKKDTYTEVQVKYNDQEVALLQVKSFAKEKIEFDYEISYEDIKFKGDFLLYVEQHSYNIAFSYKEGADYANFDLYLDFNSPEEFAVVKQENVISYSDRLYEKEWDAFICELDEVGLADSYNFWFEFLSAIVEEASSVEDLLPDSSISSA